VTKMVGIACRKKGTALFKKDLQAVGVYVYTNRWEIHTFSTSEATAILYPNLQSTTADVQGKLLKDGKWITVMGRGAGVWEDPTDK